MEVIYDRTEGIALGGSVVTIGAYDGIHLGHRAIMENLKNLAKTHSVPSVVVTFDRHPATVVRPTSAPKLITDLESRLELLEGLGIDYVYLIEFDAVRATESAGDFVDQVLVAALGATAVLVGSDFHFGHNREGTVEFLTERGSERGFVVHGIELVKVGSVNSITPALSGVPISSTLIRSLIAEGDVHQASVLLGRDHCIRGMVTFGDRRGGGSLGFPTANVEPPGQMAIPADGIYAGHLRILPHRESVMAAISVGTRPTFYPAGGPRLIESYLLDFSGDLYSQAVEITFKSFIRPQATFSDSRALAAQIKLDVLAIREALS